ncbi:hypothetical protein A2W13_01310 [Candidatus Woesebacteria bacterium RBG_16_36_11]|uniref:YoaR-like putative peptidoglycan binding domain-containing protein n=3 Tax=Candidatus Woeseibacteriota TaxID=1752722 RepID=A0A1F7XD65_9BACT|nr:MAG: hypothetical protein A2Z67_03315 [Candidatus Woesebacteria bacterium RBG_13_36_22]OGM12265.1 MAG: hypothetical protein A2W13_01310 [Candidatus Woesebacteria bacterium RBG_16_36_11]OGM16317.1 MAG: hypothetical protein A2V55_01205 [Candidatus Woesebacteria bacterium RBG_19FT_COMBO_37_29]
MIKIKKPKFISLKIPRLMLIWVVFLLVIFAFYHSLFIGRIYPGIFISGINVAGKTPEEAENLLKFSIKPPKEIILSYKDQSFSIPVSDLNLNYDLSTSVAKSYRMYRSNDLFQNIILSIVSPINKTNFPLAVTLNENKLRENLSAISGKIGQEPIYPSIYLSQGKLVVEKGSLGYEIDNEKIIKDIMFSLSYLKTPQISISTKINDPSLSDKEVEILYNRGDILLNKSLILSFEFQEFSYSKSDIINLLDPKSGYNETKLNSFISNIISKVERNPQNPVFVFTDGMVKEFAPAKDGIKVKQTELLNNIKTSLNDLESTDKTSVTISIPTTNSSPEYKIEDVNNLGIKELLGRGVSHFTGSITSRIHNISLASSKFNGILIKPGETFSFNNTLGDVSAFTGYQQAYIIQDGKTVLGDGGGVCQVSTTFFRAALNAGLPIVERRAHSYRVGYYEQGSPVGIDATVFSPTTDLKIQNDTPAHLLIQTSIDTKTKTLVFEIYGTNDGRIATISKPSISGVTPPPDDLYIDDPTLPAGTIKQIDWKAWGAKVNFIYKVIRNNETLIDKTFYSNYQPWQAKFLRGTGLAQ